MSFCGPPLSITHIPVCPIEIKRSKYSLETIDAENVSVLRNSNRRRQVLASPLAERQQGGGEAGDPATASMLFFLCPLMLRLHHRLSWPSYVSPAKCIPAQHTAWGKSAIQQAGFNHCICQNNTRERVLQLLESAEITQRRSMVAEQRLLWVGLFPSFGSCGAGCSKLLRTHQQCLSASFSKLEKHNLSHRFVPWLWWWAESFRP